MQDSLGLSKTRQGWTTLEKGVSIGISGKIHCSRDVPQSSFQQVGLSTMWEDGTVFACYTSMWDVIYYSELGSSWSVLAAGYNLDSLMMRYQGVDWTVLENWECNAK